MINLKQFSKVVPSTTLHLRHTSLLRDKCFKYRFLHLNAKNQGKSHVGKYTIGSLIFGFSAVVAYAKYDNNFRQWLKINVPGSDDILKLILLEKKSPNDYIDNVIQIFMKPEKALSSVEKVQKLKVLPSQNIKNTSSTIENSQGIKQNILEKESDFIDGNQTKSSSKQSAGIDEIENEASILIKKVTESYSKAFYALKEYYELANTTLNNVSQTNDSCWETLKQTSKEKDNLYEAAKENLRYASIHLENLVQRINNSDLKLPDEEKVAIKENIIKKKFNLKTIETEFEVERNNLLLFSKYHDQVIKTRRQFSDELEGMFPHIRLGEKDMKLSNSEYELFMKYVIQKLLFLQRELFKEETVVDDQVKNAIDGLIKEDPDALNYVLKIKVQKTHRKLLEKFINDSFEIQSDCDGKLRQQLKLKAEIHLDHLKEAANLAEREVDRRLRLEYSEKAEIERLKYQEQVISTITVLHAIDDALKDHSKKEEKLNESISLWTACKSLFEVITTDQNVSKHELKPLLQYIKNIKNAGQNHKIVNQLLETIPNEVLTRGVYTEETLKDRFYSVEDKAYHNALIPEKNLNVIDMFTSFVFSSLIFKSVKISEDELNNSPININDLNNIEILQRARYWVERDNFIQALKYMNFLKGGAKVIADEWMKETRTYLETQQAADTLLAYASSKLHSHIVVKN
ncbi:MICOS complex subunit Mic60-like [Daktulosphaira vitifoliae]|uniref:MICOS complex subunit Mic60-like n=1 Tax=Daktulosphaira vitifoliae TaxID=58002 RepID=UPI0021A99BD4|nr:MICOS complex subunit Mic60-like [Daktulosphaira vitifoliae]